MGRQKGSDGLKPGPKQPESLNAIRHCNICGGINPPDSDIGLGLKRPGDGKIFYICNKCSKGLTREGLEKIFKQEIT